MPSYAFFDTSAFTGARDLTTASWQKITSAIGQGVLRAATSEITVLESGRQAVEAVDAKAKQVAQARIALAPFGIDVALPAVPPHDRLQRLLPEWLHANCVAVVPIPDTPHAEVVARDIAVRAPFIRSGKGYRDTLIWLSFLTWLQQLPELAEDVFLVTSNSQDFCGPSGGLKAELLAELPQGVRVDVLEKPQDLAARVEVTTPPNAATVATEHALKFIETALLHEELDADLLTWGTGVEEASVSQVFADDGEAQLVEILDGDIELWSVEIVAELGVNGYVHKADLPGLDNSLTVMDPDWNSHYAEVAGHISCTVTVLVRLESDLETSESEVQELIV